MTVVWFSLLHYYTTFTGFVAYLLLPWKHIKASPLDFTITVGVLSLMCSQLIVKDPVLVLMDFRFYWGWLIFYYIFKSRFVDYKSMENVLVVLCVITIVEMVLINTVIPPYILPNYPDIAGGVAEYVGEGRYQRPYAFGGSATVGSVVIVALVALLRVTGWRLWLAITTVVIFLSGTGLLLMGVLLLVYYRELLLKSAIPAFMLLAIMLAIFSEQATNYFDLIAMKAGPDYISLIIDIKSEQIYKAYASVDGYMYVIGDPNGFRGGDFGALAFTLSNGVVGFFLLIAMAVSRINRLNVVPMIVIMAGSFHYPVMFFLPGQMLFGLLLTMGPKAVNGVQFMSWRVNFR